MFIILVLWRKGIFHYRYLKHLNRFISLTSTYNHSFQNYLVGDSRRNATSQLRLKARLSMKSLNLNLKPVCCQCNIAKGRKKARLETEHQELSEDEENDKETVEEADDSDESEEDLAIGTGTKKRKRSGENHTHCHCSLFQVTDGLINFMSAGQPYQRFKTDQIKRRDAVKVDRVLLLQTRKQGYYILFESVPILLRFCLIFTLSRFPFWLD